MEDTIWKKIFNHLKTIYPVYAPGEKTGECITPYLVLKNNGSSKVLGISSIQDYYTILVYVPKSAYSDLEKIVQEVYLKMKDLKPLIEFTGSKTPSFTDESIKAQTISLEYINYKKL